jgi:hypothetical protein
VSVTEKLSESDEAFRQACEDLLEKYPFKPTPTAKEAVGQSRTASLAETATHIAIGFGIALWLTGYLFPGISHWDNARVTTIFTAVSLVRGFVVRRIFNYLTINE